MGLKNIVIGMTNPVEIYTKASLVKLLLTELNKLGSI